MASTGTTAALIAAISPNDSHCINPSFIRDEEERPKVAHDDFSDQIPVISLAGIDETDGDRRSEVSKKVAAACEEWGIFQVVDHGVDLKVIRDMARLAREFFDLPVEEKLRLDMSGGKKGGFTVSSHLKGEAVENWREIFTFFTYPIQARDYSRWPENPAGWREAAEFYSEAVMKLGAKLLEVLAEAMDLPRDSIAKACVEMDQKVVVNYYPKCPQPNLTLGLKRHTDPGTITLLLQDQVGGLQATKDGGRNWITVQPIEGALVVNLGDHGHYLSNGRFKNADHQAVVNSNCSRLSIATFQNPAPEAIVYPLNIRQGEKAITDEAMSFSDMYRRKMSTDIELARLRRLAAKEKKLQTQEDMEKVANFEVKSNKGIEEVRA